MLEYLKDHILEELDGAVDYMEKAVEFKGTEMGCKFRMMSHMESEHAGILTKMFNKMEKPDKVTDSDYSKMNKEILTHFTNSMNTLEALKKIYWSE